MNRKPRFTPEFYGSCTFVRPVALVPPMVPADNRSDKCLVNFAMPAHGLDAALSRAGGRAETMEE